MRIMPSSIRQALQILILLLSIGCVAGWGQTFQGSFTGIVTDQTGAVVPGTVVTITEKDRGFSRTVTTSNDGSYAFPLLPPGRYTVVAKKPGFRIFARGPLPLLVNQHLREDIGLLLNVGGYYVPVEGFPETVETQTSSIGTTIDAQKVNEVPLNGRNFWNSHYWYRAYPPELREVPSALAAAVAPLTLTECATR